MNLDQNFSRMVPATS